MRLPLKIASLATLLASLITLCASPPARAMSFTEDPTFLSAVHELQVTGTGPSDMYVRLVRNGGTRNFRVHMVNGSGYGQYQTLATHIDMNGDGVWDLSLTGFYSEATLDYTYPEPTRWGDFYKAKVRIEMINGQGLGAAYEQTQEIFVTKQERYFVGTGENYIAQLRDEESSSRTGVLLVEGIDNSNNTGAWKYAYQFPDLLDDLYAHGCEVFVLNFNDGGANLRANASVLLDAVSAVSSRCPNSQVAVMGFSMGAVITRYALANTEWNGGTHNVGLFISHDAPHGGANHSPDLLDDIAAVGISNRVVDALKAELMTPASKQLLLYDPYAGSADSFFCFHQHLDTLNTTGFPHRSFNAAISNGNFVHSVGTGWLSQERHIADLTIAGVPVIHIDAANTDLGVGGLVSDQTPAIRGDLFDIPFLEWSLTVNFDPVFIPTWSALGREAWTVPMGCFNAMGDIDANCFGPVPFDDYLVQTTPCMHMYVSDESRAQILSWMNLTSICTIQYQLPGGATTAPSTSVVPILHGADVTIQPQVVNGRTYVFEHWDDGSTQNPHRIYASHDTVRTVVMKERLDFEWSREALPSGLAYMSSSQDPSGGMRWMTCQKSFGATDSLWIGFRSGCEWTFASVVNQGQPGLASAVGGGPSGNAGVLYYKYDASTQHYRLSYLRYTAGYGWAGETLIGSNMPLGPLAIQMDGNSVAHLLYKSTAGYLVYEKINWSGTVLDGMPVTGPDPMEYVSFESCAIALTSAGVPVVAFEPIYSMGETGPLVAYYPTPGSGTTRYNTPAWTISDADPYGRGDGVSLALDASNRPHLSYRDTYGGAARLTHAWWSGTEWHSELLPPNVRPATVIRLAPDGLVRIATLVPVAGGTETPSYYYESAPGDWIGEAAGSTGSYYPYKLSMDLNETGHGTISFAGPTSVSARPGTPDNTPPSTVTDLAVSTGPHTALLEWTAPGDDGTDGTAANYDIRYSSSSISPMNFDQAAKFPLIPCPSQPGITECASVAGLNPSSAYFFALKVRDNAGNWSGLSNVVAMQTKHSGLDVACFEGFHAQPAEEDAPARVQLAIASTNPTSGPLKLDLAVPKSSDGTELRVSVFDLSGRLVRDLAKGPATVGRQTLLWDLTSRGAGRVRSGVYYVRAVIGSEKITRAVVVLD